MTTINASDIDVEAELDLLDTWTRRHLEILCFLLPKDIPRSFFGHLVIPYDESKKKFSPFGFTFEYSGARFPTAVAFRVIEMMDDTRKAEVLTFVVEMLYREHVRDDMYSAANLSQHVMKLEELLDLFNINIDDRIAGKVFDIFLYCSWYPIRENPLPNAIDLAYNASKHCHEESTEGRIRWSTLHYTHGIIAFGQSALESAENYFDACHRTRLDQLGQLDPHTVAALMNLLPVSCCLGHFDKILDKLSPILQIEAREALFKKLMYSASILFGYAAVALLNLNRYPEALDHLERALSFQGHPEIEELSPRYRDSALRAQWGRYMEILLDVYPVGREKVFEEDTGDLEFFQGNISIARNKPIEESLRLHEKSLRIRRGSYSENRPNPRTAASLYRIGDLKARSGLGAEALDLLSASVSMYNKMGADNRGAEQGKARSLWRMSTIMRLRGQHDGADHCASRAEAAMQELALGSSGVFVEKDFKGYLHWMDL